MQVSIGKCTLRQAVKFISDHQQNPSEWTAERIANDFKLQHQTVEQILLHFRMFEIHIPKTQGNTKQYLLDPRKAWKAIGDSKSEFDKLLDQSKATPKKFT